MLQEFDIVTPSLQGVGGGGSSDRVMINHHLLNSASFHSTVAILCDHPAGLQLATVHPHRGHILSGQEAEQKAAACREGGLCNQHAGVCGVWGPHLLYSCTHARMHNSRRAGM